ncbi:MAG: VOC family protein [Anaerolineae bacterium]|nr:VOC family protein [Anaerolineae bacterium]
MAIQGIHHITAVTGDLQRNVTFYTQVLGLRLVKRTVIQEEPTTYHLFYGDRVGSIGTGLTFFDWPQFKPHRHGARNVNWTLLHVPSAAALDWWAHHLPAHGVEIWRGSNHEGRDVLTFTAPDGLSLALIADASSTPYQHWDANPVPESYAIRGIHSAELGVREMSETTAFLQTVFGYNVAASDADYTRLVLDNGGPGRELTLVHEPDFGFRGVGSVHHIALGIAPEDSIESWRSQLIEAGLEVTDVIRRYYFDSIYARIPGGILFELATVGRGLAVDEDEATLGQRLTLPPFLEPQRAQIEAQLKPFPTLNAISDQ